MDMIESKDLGVAMYGLPGLRLLDSHRYEEARTQLSQRDGSVMLGRGGCCFRATAIPQAIAYLEAELEKKARVSPAPAACRCASPERRLHRSRQPD